MLVFAVAITCDWEPWTLPPESLTISDSISYCFCISETDPDNNSKELSIFGLGCDIKYFLF